MDKLKNAFRACGVVILFYAIFVFSGGFMGFAMKGSIPSLVMGSVFGLSLLLSSVLVLTCRKWGLYVAFILMFLLDTFFTYRYILTESFFPAGMMLLLTSLTIILLILMLAKISKQAQSL